MYRRRFHQGCHQIAWLELHVPARLLRYQGHQGKSTPQADPYQRALGVQRFDASLELIACAALGLDSSLENNIFGVNTNEDIARAGVPGKSDELCLP